MKRGSRGLLADAEGDATSGPIRLSFNSQLRVEFRGAMAPDVIERTAPVRKQPGAGAGVSRRRGGSGGKAAEHVQSTRLVLRERFGSPITKWPDGLREASRGPLSKPRGKRTWSISEIPDK